MVRVRATRTIENALRRWGFYRIAGCDEVGRGCLAGPVVAGAVVLDPGLHIAGLADSKMLTAVERERLNDLITSRALAWSVAFVQPAEIDQLNIHRASLEAMRRAVMAIAPLPDAVLVDAFRIPDLRIAQRGVLHGDRRCAAIAAASIVAKVSRDRQMMTEHASDPRYGYDKHKGYATAEHRAAVERFGYSSLHRRSFKPQAGLFDRIE
jgi:ribonuclease HII